jgi:hypothetical protein
MCVGLALLQWHARLIADNLVVRIKRFFSCTIRACLLSALPKVTTAMFSIPVVFFLGFQGTHHRIISAQQYLFGNYIAHTHVVYQQR